MADITITFTDGTEHTYQNAPESLTPEDVVGRVEQDFGGKKIKSLDRKSYAEMSAGQVAGEAVKNVPKSFAKLIGGVAEAVTSPLQTAQTVLDIGAGALQAATPKPIADFINSLDTNPEAAQRAANLASAVGGQYKDRYGSVEGIKKAIATDPVGVASDLSAILGIGGAVTPGRVGATLTKAADITNPLSVAAKGGKAAVEFAGKNVVAPMLGVSSGVGTAPIKEAYKAGRTGGKVAEDFTSNLRGKAEMTDVLEAAKQNLNAMSQERQAIYRANMANIKADQSILGFEGIDKAVERAINKVSYKGQITKKAAADKLGEVQSIIDDWKNLDPATYHTPEGLDALKQKVGDVLESIPFESKTARSAVGDVYHAVKGEIQTQAPTYSKTMQAYSEASDLIREIERALSLNKKASVDTQMRKLQSIMRNNVSTNYGQRAKLVDELERAGGIPMKPSLAGQALSDIAPRGIQRATTLPEALMAFSMFGAPGAAASLVASSPRAVGEAAYGAGRTARGLLDVGRKLPDISYAEYLNFLAQTQR